MKDPQRLIEGNDSELTVALLRTWQQQRPSSRALGRTATALGVGASAGAAARSVSASTSTLAVASIGFFAFYKIDGQAAGLALWQLFGSTNQLLAGLALLVVALYLIQRRRPSLPYLLPMAFMMVSTLSAMALKLSDFLAQGQYLLLVVGGCISLVSIWLVVEAVLALARYRREGRREDPEVAGID